MSQLEAWEKVLVDNEDGQFGNSTHGIVGCMICHEGDSSSPDMATAHTGLLADPSSADACSTCHAEIEAHDESSLHSTLSGFETVIESRGGDLSEGSLLVEAMGNHCESCHTTCGQCHVSRPDSADGGFLDGHEFEGTPSMTNNCTACHGSRVGDEYLGQNSGVKADVHRRKGMQCYTCHSVELHGSGELEADRYHNSESISCEDCHSDVIGTNATNTYHQIHYNILSCQVCHSVEYKNCYNCHVEQSEEGTCYYVTDPSVMGFEVGLNPIQSVDRPYEYVVLRHVPVSPATFASYGDNLLPDFDATPTWKYATPHNIQLNTPQNDGCNYCHGQEQIFLMPDDVAADELEANEDVIVRQVPGVPSE